MTPRKPPTALLLAVPMLLAAAAYARVLHGEFVFDDARVVKGNQALGDPAAVLGRFTDSLLHGGRPTTEVTFALTHAIGGPNPLAFHAGNLLLHLLVVVLVFVFTREVLRLAGRGPSPGIALAVSGIFALHPVQTQAVSYVSQRSEVLASGFYLATLLLLLRAARPGGWPGRVLAGASALATFTFGMGAKAIVATAPLSWLLLVTLVPPAGERRSPTSWRSRLLLLAPAVLVGILLVQGAVRAVVGRPDAGFSVPGLTPWTYFLTQLRVVATYVRLLAWPAGQNADWSVKVSSGAGDPAVLGAGAFLAAMLLGAVLLWRRSRRGTGPGAADGRAAAFGVAWFFLLLAPTSSFFPIADLLVEHRVYLASWGLFLAVVLGADRLLDRVAPGRRALVATTVLGATFCLLATATWRRNAVWEGELVFWRDAVEKSPGKARPRQGLGTALVRSGDVAGGVAEFSAGLARVPPEASALRLALLHNLGNALIKLGRPAEAVEPLRRAVELDPNEVPPREGLALALWRTGDLDGAIREARGALDRKPDSAPAALVLGQALMGRGDEAGAVRWLEQAVRASPGDPVVRYNLGAAYGNLGRVAEACATWRAVLLLPPAGNAHASAREGMAILACPP